MTSEAARPREAIGPESPPRRFFSRGWLRALWCTPLVGFAGVGLACVIRWAAHWEPVWSGVPLTTVALVSFPLGLLVSIGAFDYWAYYASGRPTRHPQAYVIEGTSLYQRLRPTPTRTAT